MKLLIIDENEIVRRHLFWALRREHELHEALGREEALAMLPELAPDVILLEPFEERDPDQKAGMALVEHLLAQPAPPTLLIITRSDGKEVATRLLSLGAADIFGKPVESDELMVVLRRIARLRELQPAITAPSSKDDAPKGKIPGTPHPDNDLSLGIIGVDRRIKQIMEQVRRIAATPVSVQITGETGTGKEVFARAIHTLSERREQPWVPLNCAVLSENLVEDELFGHERGAFTGAVERRQGKFEYANKGTLFLDEIGDLSLRLQAKFLRVLQERTFERLGGNRSLQTDFRLISATHRDLTEMNRQGSFREDLMFRINVVSFHIPPLRERRGDIRLLSEHFLAEFTRVFRRKDAMSFSREVVNFMHDYAWPGNVRELRHFVERAVALTEGRTIGRESLPDTLSLSKVGDSLVTGKGNLDIMVKKYKRQLVMEALESTGNNKVQTAQILGISKSYLFKLIKQLSVPA